MKTLRIEGRSGASDIMIGRADVKSMVGGRRPVVITDYNVARLHESPMPGASVIEVAAGEPSKTLDSARSVYMRLMRLELDRTGFIVGFGGGVVCDLAGFVASTYLRGIGFGFVPTTLLAQVDAAIGGKNGLNLEGYKNLIGTFTQPEFVACDVGYLSTLPPEEMRSGMAEALKAGAIGDAALFELIESRGGDPSAYDEAALAEVVERAAAVKAGIVSADEREAGLRRVLNFGHTFGHALERANGLAHGDAVAMGMVVAANLSVAQDLIGRAKADRLIAAVKRLGFRSFPDLDASAAIDAMRKDKKRVGEAVEFVLLTDLGGATTRSIPIEALEEVANDLHKYL